MKVKVIAKKIIRCAATIGVSVLGAVLFVCANTASCGMVHQPSTPDGLERFSKVK